MRVYDLFNDLNSDDAFDVHCRYEPSTGTRIRRPQFKDEVSNAAARARVYGLKDACGGLTQDAQQGSAVGRSMPHPLDA